MESRHRSAEHRAFSFLRIPPLLSCLGRYSALLFQSASPKRDIIEHKDSDFSRALKRVWPFCAGPHGTPGPGPTEVALVPCEPLRCTEVSATVIRKAVHSGEGMARDALLGVGTGCGRTRLPGGGCGRLQHRGQDRAVRGAVRENGALWSGQEECVRQIGAHREGEERGEAGM